MNLLLKLGMGLTGVLAVPGGVPRAEAGAPITASVLLSIPHPVNLGVDLRVSPSWSLGLGGGYLGASLPSGSSQVSVSSLNAEGRARWHSFGGAFFLGLVGGYRSFAGSSTADVAVGTLTVPTRFSVNIPSLFVTPHLGWFWNMQKGLGLGFELGTQIPIAPSTSSTVEVTDSSLTSQLPSVLTTAAYSSLETAVNRIGNAIGSRSLPYIAFRIGFAF